MMTLVPLRGALPGYCRATAVCETQSLVVQMMVNQFPALMNKRRAKLFSPPSRGRASADDGAD